MAGLSLPTPAHVVRFCANYSSKVVQCLDGLWECFAFGEESKQSTVLVHIQKQVKNVFRLASQVGIAML